MKQIQKSLSPAMKITLPFFLLLVILSLFTISTFATYVPALDANANKSYTAGSTAGKFVNGTASAADAVFTSGKVGIGTSDPVATLDVQKAEGNTILKIGKNPTNYSYFGIDAGGQYIEYKGVEADGGKMRIQSSVDGLEGYNYSQFYIDPKNGYSFTSTGNANGNVGIGTTIPTEKLEVRGNAKISSTTPSGSPYLVFQSAEGALGVSMDSAKITNIAETINGWGLKFETKTQGGLLTEKVRITNNGNVGIGTTTPLNKLEVLGSGNPIASSTTNGARFGDIENGVNIGGSDAGDYGWISSRKRGIGEKNLLLNPLGGNVGIGSILPPTEKLEVAGNIKANDPILSTHVATKNYVDSKVDSSDNNLLSIESWDIGSGNSDGFSAISGPEENTREWGINPYGIRGILWKASPDASSGPDGGWNTAAIPIDDTKAYRSSVWIKKTGSNNGTTYFGSQGSNSLSLNGLVDGNPYYYASDLPELDKWYLLVAYIHGSGDTSTTSYGGVYDGETGKKIRSLIDFKNAVGATTQQQRAYLYYDTATTDRQYFYGPRFEEINGNEPSIQALVGKSTGIFTTGINNSQAVYNGGYVGIGTTDPTAPLDVRGVTGIKIGVGGATDTAWGLGSIKKVNASENYISFGTTKGTELDALNNVEDALVIKRKGNVGIGTTNPSAKLEIAGVYGDMLSLTSPNSRSMVLGHNVNESYIDVNFGDNFIVKNASGQPFKIVNSGDIGIGFAEGVSPTQKLQVNGNIKATSFILETLATNPTNPVEGQMWLVQ